MQRGCRYRRGSRRRYATVYRITSSHWGWPLSSRRSTCACRFAVYRSRTPSPPHQPSPDVFSQTSTPVRNLFTSLAAGCTEKPRVKTDLSPVYESICIPRTGSTVPRYGKGSLPVSYTHLTLPTNREV